MDLLEDAVANLRSCFVGIEHIVYPPRSWLNDFVRNVVGRDMLLHS